MDLNDKKNFGFPVGDLSGLGIQNRTATADGPAENTVANILRSLMNIEGKNCPLCIFLKKFNCLTLQC